MGDGEMREKREGKGRKRGNGQGDIGKEERDDRDKGKTD